MNIFVLNVEKCLGIKYVFLCTQNFTKLYMLTAFEADIVVFTISISSVCKDLINLKKILI